jgi:signal transduction histidine kinase
MNRLWIRLTLAFIVVTQLSIFVIALLASWSIQSEFGRYVVRRDISSNTAKDLIYFYESHGDWKGVDQVFVTEKETRIFKQGSDVTTSDTTTEASLFTKLFPIPSESIQSIQQAPESGIAIQNLPFNIDAPLPPQFPAVAIADNKGRIVYTRIANRIGTELDNGERSIAVPLIASDKTKPIGFVLPEPILFGMNFRTPELDYLERLQNYLMVASVVVGAMSILLGLVISRTMVAPLASLARTARAFAAHDWSRRVKASGADEIADVAHAFNEMADELQRAESQRRSMIADIAHELRTPLTVMQGNLRAILDEVYPLSKQEIATLYDETRVLSRLVDDLRELALADAGRLTLHLSEVDPVDLLTNTVANFMVAAEGQDTTITLQTTDTLPYICADADRLAQILRNLLSNALHYTSNGNITVAAKVLTVPKSMLQISVADTGEGIPPDDLPYVFDRFYRGDKPRNRTGGSTGLGLAIAKAWVEAMDGCIGVESQYGQGSTFWFTLPTIS